MLTTAARSAPARSRFPALTELSDEELVARARGWGGDRDALGVLVERYRGLVRVRAHAYFLVGGDRDDVVQEGMVGLYKAIRDFDPQHDTTFKAFAELCVVRQIQSAVKRATRRKHDPLNTYVSIDTSAGAEDDLPLAELLRSPDLDPEDHAISVVDMARTGDHLRRILSDLEADVLRRYLAGQSYTEIAAQLSRQAKSIDNALQRIKRKLDEYLNARMLADGADGHIV